MLAYTPSGGTPEYLHSLQVYYRGVGIELGLDELMATTGGSEAILFALLACANEGDDVLVVEPFYTNYSAFATMAGVRLVPLTARGRGRLPPAAARGLGARAHAAHARSCSSATRTTRPAPSTRAEELETVAAFCRDHGLFLISDEVYREFVYDGACAISALTLAGCEELVVVVDSLSKRYSACGIRLGSLVTRNRERARGLRAHGAGPAVAAGPRPDRRVRRRPSSAPSTRATWSPSTRQRRDVLFEGLSGIPGVFLRKPEGAFYFVARLPVDGRGGLRAASCSPTSSRTARP